MKSNLSFSEKLEKYGNIDRITGDNNGYYNLTWLSINIVLVSMTFTFLAVFGFFNYLIEQYTNFENYIINGDPRRMFTLTFALLVCFFPARALFNITQVATTPTPQL